MTNTTPTQNECDNANININNNNDDNDNTNTDTDTDTDIKNITSTHSPDFESALRQLESLINEMETGQLSLEESLNAFEKGVKLTKICQSALEKAEQRVQILVQNNKTDVLTPYE